MPRPVLVPGVPIRPIPVYTQPTHLPYSVSGSEDEEDDEDFYDSESDGGRSSRYVRTVYSDSTHSTEDDVVLVRPQRRLVTEDRVIVRHRREPEWEVVERRRSRSRSRSREERERERRRRERRRRERAREREKEEKARADKLKSQLEQLENRLSDIANNPYALEAMAKDTSSLPNLLPK